MPIVNGYKNIFSVLCCKNKQSKKYSENKNPHYLFVLTPKTDAQDDEDEEDDASFA